MVYYFIGARLSFSWTCMDEFYVSYWGELSGLEYPFVSSSHIYCYMSRLMGRLHVLYYVVIFNHEDSCIVDIRQSRCSIHILRVLLDTNFWFHSYLYNHITGHSSLIYMCFGDEHGYYYFSVGWSTLMLLVIVYCLMPEDYYITDDIVTRYHYTGYSTWARVTTWTLQVELLILDHLHRGLTWAYWTLHQHIHIWRVFFLEIPCSYWPFLARVRSHDGSTYCFIFEEVLWRKQHMVFLLCPWFLWRVCYLPWI